MAGRVLRQRVFNIIQRVNVCIISDIAHTVEAAVLYPDATGRKKTEY